MNIGVQAVTDHESSFGVEIVPRNIRRLEREEKEEKEEQERGLFSPKSQKSQNHDRINRPLPPKSAPGHLEPPMPLDRTEARTTGTEKEKKEKPREGIEIWPIAKRELK